MLKNMIITVIIILNKNQNRIVFFVALILLINGVFIKVLADSDDHIEKKWYKTIFDSDDDVVIPP